jgi:YggT family protein
METYTTVTTRPAVHYGIRIVWYVLDVLEILLLLRFALKLFAANPFAIFANFIYQITNSFAYPFLAVFRSTPLQNGGVIEWNALLAMLVFYLIAMVIIRLFLMDRVVSTETVKHY